MEQVTLKKTGILIGGTALLSLWGGGEGTIKMEKTFLSLDQITPKNILRCVNDNGFGCEAIISAEIDISDAYEHGYIEYNRTIKVDSPIHAEYFLGWNDLREQGIIV